MNSGSGDCPSYVARAFSATLCGAWEYVAETECQKDRSVDVDPQTSVARFMTFCAVIMRGGYHGSLSGPPPPPPPPPSRTPLRMAASPPRCCRRRRAAPHLRIAQSLLQAWLVRSVAELD